RRIQERSAGRFSTIFCPKRLLERHHNRAALGQLVKDPLGVSSALDLKRERKPLRLLVAIRRDIATHQELVAKREAAMHDLVLPVGGDLVRQRTSGITEDRPQ